MIERNHVTQFYSGYRGNFDYLCCNVVAQLKKLYPHVILTKVLSYLPSPSDELNEIFDDSVYLLERKVPYRLAIVETNKRLADTADFILSGVVWQFGGAFTALEYALKREKRVINVFDGK